MKEAHAVEKAELKQHYEQRISCLEARLKDKQYVSMNLVLANDVLLPVLIPVSNATKAPLDQQSMHSEISRVVGQLAA